jgi:hypothetical protein
MTGITSQHLTGFAVGIGAAAVGFYLYKQNQPAVDEWLRKQGINVPNASVRDYGALSIEELVAEKERLEDLIAEREYAAMQPPAEESAPAEGAS